MGRPLPRIVTLPPPVYFPVFPSRRLTIPFTSRATLTGDKRLVHMSEALEGILTVYIPTSHGASFRGQSIGEQGEFAYD
jgi:hypothetical protein